MFSTGTTQLRCENPKEYLQQLGIDIRIGTIYRSVPTAGEISLFHRVSLDRYTRLFMDYVSLTGGVLAYDVDDLIFTKSGGEYLTRIGKKSRSGVEAQYLAAMERCDFITVSTPYLVAEAQRRIPNAKVRLIRNALNSNLFAQADGIIEERSKRSNEYVTLAYLSGSRSHDQDFAVIEPQLLKLLAENKKCKLLVCGDLNFSSEFMSFENQFEYRSRVPYSEYAKVFSEIDINLVPLDTREPFNHAKSELKYIEAGLFAIPSVMSPTKTYQKIVENGVNGIIAADDQWYEALQLMVHNSSMRVTIGEAARQHVVKNYSPACRIADWETLFKEFQYIADTKRSAASFDKQFVLKTQLEYMRACRMAKAVVGRLKRFFSSNG
jgi:glycosyltransferase involved in cell wall biosynthesis